MMAELGRSYVLGKIEESLAERDPDEVREWAGRWLKGEVSLIDELLRKQVDAIRPYKAIAIQVMQRLTITDLRTACHEGRPELDDIWSSEAATRRMETELKEIGGFLERL